ncbi:type I restriction-modification system subunit M N-terminal domain-containing protein [Arthrobacter sp. Sr24]
MKYVLDRRHLQPIEIIEQITYLLFLKRLDEAQTRAEKQAVCTRVPARNLPLPLGNDQLRRPRSHLRWKGFENLAKDEMFRLFSDRRFTFLREELVLQSFDDGLMVSKNAMENAEFHGPTLTLATTARRVELARKTHRSMIRSSFSSSAFWLPLS